MCWRHFCAARHRKSFGSVQFLICHFSIRSQTPSTQVQKMVSSFCNKRTMQIVQGKNGTYCISSFMSIMLTDPSKYASYAQWSGTSSIILHDISGSFAITHQFFHFMDKISPFGPKGPDSVQTAPEDLIQCNPRWLIKCFGIFLQIDLTHNVVESITWEGFSAVQM